MADGITLSAGAADGPVLATDDAGAGGHVQITKLAISTDGSASLIPADGTNGLDVDITRIAAGDNLVGRVKISDGTDVALVSAGGALLTDASATTQPVSNAGLTALNGAISGTEVQVDVVGALPAGTNAIGKLAANSGVDIGDVDVTSLPATPAGTNLIGRVSASDETSTIYNATTALTPKFAIIDAASSGDNTLVAAVNPKKLRVHALFLVSAGTVTVRFESGASGTALSGQMNLVANTGFVLPYNPVGWFETASNTLLNLELSGAISVDGSLVYTEV